MAAHLTSWDLRTQSMSPACTHSTTAPARASISPYCSMAGLATNQR